MSIKTSGEELKKIRRRLRDANRRFIKLSRKEQRIALARAPPCSRRGLDTVIMPRKTCRLASSSLVPITEAKPLQPSPAMLYRENFERVFPPEPKEPTFADLLELE